ncbi:hypothetical protein [Neisseria sicca]|uniref:hypothetical protein n=1 Tax=Neisseria sicca TaxID=490 RepID=UPI0002E20DEF|nr:hypothetical protein [Neisseria sicca]
MMRVLKGRLKEYSQGVWFRLCMVVVQEIFYFDTLLSDEERHADLSFTVAG